MRRPFIAGNWKMNKTAQETASLTNEIKKLVDGVDDIDIAVFPPFLSVNSAVGILKDSNVKVGTQNMYFEENGAFTGEVSADMIKESGAEIVILGHSERRHIFGETDELINKKLKKALSSSIRPIVCIGEKLEEREGNKTEDVLNTQLKGSLAGISDEDMIKTVIAYEPVWAIGTGKTASPEQAESAHVYVRKVLSEMFSSEVAEQVVIQYGGSVKPENVDTLMNCDNIDGALVGGASMKAESFEKLVKYKR
ncbi:MAG: triose-phosphate isomerase [Candidatus Aureabacteria bacterium]|nr:triose-phosphate isomerase [Candidatus Auribacterota bacterium]